MKFCLNAIKSYVYVSFIRVSVTRNSHGHIRYVSSEVRQS